MQYQLNMDAILGEAKQAQSTTNNFSDAPKTNWIKLKDGITTLRILPIPGGSQHKRDLPWYGTTKHFGFMAPWGKTHPLICSMETYGKCPLCQLSDELSTKKDEDQRSRGVEIRPQPRYLYTVLTDTQEIGIMDLDSKAHTAILQAISAYRRQDANFNPFDLVNGRWFDIQKTKDSASKRQKFPRNVFSVTVHLQPSPIPQSVVNKYSEIFVYPEEVNKAYTPEQLSKIINGDWSFLGGKYAKSDDADFNPVELEQSIPVSASRPIVTSGYAAVPPSPSIARPIPVTNPNFNTPTLNASQSKQNSIDDELKELGIDI